MGKKSKDKKSDVNKSEYVFWKYDSIPYALYGEVDSILENGNVKVKGYGGMTVNKDDIICIVPHDKGLKLTEKLDKAEKKYREQKAVAYETLMKTVRALYNVK
jgi:hypothetical protein